ncbi:MAG: DNA primase [Chloroflexi bacterium]|nr:DNA primase [Chloroflexota bacterium]
MSLADDVKRRLDIVQVVSEYVDLDTRSRTPKARCPFHAENTPSFVVFPESQLWRCFGACATGGDVISFLARQHKVDFREALRLAAARAGIKEISSGRDERRASPLVAANEAAHAYFAAVLASPRGESARQYLSGRGIDGAAARRRELGLCPDGLESLAGHLQSKGIAAGVARAAGLVTQTRDGAWRDMFAGRLTVAIRDTDGRLAGFGARTLTGAEPKYLNSPRTDLFDKSRLLYGLHWAKDSIRLSGTAVVVEGYMDAIAAHENGFENVVASMGTAITRDQVEHVRGMAKAVVLALDADAAGQEATLNSLETVWGALGGGIGDLGARQQLEIKIARLAGGKDPDEIIRGAPDAWRSTVEGATPLLDWLMDAHISRNDVTTPAGKARVTDAIFPLIAVLQNTYEQDRYASTLAGRLGVTPEQLKASAGRARAQRRRTTPAQRAPQAASEAALTTESDTALEQYLLTMVLSHEELREYASELPEEVFVDAANRTVFTAWKTSGTLERFRESVGADLAERIEHLQSRLLPPMDQRARVAAVSDCVRRLHERHLRRLKSQEARAFADPSVADDSPETRALIERRSLETNERLKNLFARQP